MKLFLNLESERIFLQISLTTFPFLFRTTVITIATAHFPAKGYVEANLDDKVIEYLETLEMLQSYIGPMNDEMARVWEPEMAPEDDLAEFVETRLLGSYLCPADFKVGLLKSKFVY
ncbi:hypothetical protein COU19_00860 [Candidatus Kaiserbacteria bacterium CG10_big_fil_rev_8_21_14_0_10_56_12]|uniref:Uncharacterized protein n=1 Tax=Candidatus Kaiserbacteria bacterium CG10_big_fil_rev_8_21_14_0_10_56_12 TaxID=1974611 RepID=A0A2H0UAD5_9BACT|nr:MAG: hypothetical protein COU19_00860 [Candidatus Kaiserbacteria bacterium CG10_big_fil_rev_8_21_14_0_10_56_12]